MIYTTNDSVVVAKLTYNPGPGISEQHRLFEARSPYAVSSDGKRFAQLRSSTEDREVVVVLNWLRELRSKLADAPKR